MDAQHRGAELQSDPVLEARNLNKVYFRSRAAYSSATGTAALRNVDLSLFPSSTLALVGRSGSGKSTLGRCLALLETPDSGEIRFRSVPVTKLASSELRQVRPQIQLVWQHSAAALNPRFRAVDLVAEPLQIQRAGSRRERHEQALTMLSKLGIKASLATRTSPELSGGQRQRLAIARALILNPAVLILDEALAGLDLPLQKKIASLLMTLKASLSLSYIFISHDLRMAASIADRIAVMEDGRIVECRSVPDLFSKPEHRATRELLNAVPSEWIRE